jgi:hypothetical protein
MRPLVPLKNNPPQMVSELIDETSVTWSEGVIHEFFLPMDTSAILSIPLCTRRQNDFWAWSYEKKGLFSVRSAYRMMINTKINRENYFKGDHVTEAKGWSTLWKTVVPSKISLSTETCPTIDPISGCPSPSKHVPN